MPIQLVKLLNPIQMYIDGTFTPKGAYDNGTDYAVGDMVSYQGSSYIMYSDAAAGTLPTDTTKWGMVASKGDTGATGEQGIQGEQGETGEQGPAGATGDAGPNEVSTATETDLTGILKGDGANIAVAVAGTDYAEADHDHVAADVTDFDTEVANNTDVAANTTARHTHSNKTLLDTYTQTEADLADAITKKHAHANSAVLDATTASFTTADETKLDAIEALADVTDAGNVAAAGAVMESDTTTASMSFVIDEDDMSSDSATKVPTQQSVKAYVDAEVAAGGGGMGDILDDQTLYFNTADTTGIRYDSDIQTLVLPDQLSAEAGITLYSNAAADGSGNYEPMLSMDASGAASLSNQSQGLEAARILTLGFSSGVRVTHGGLNISSQGLNNSFAILKTTNINTSDKTFEFPNSSGTLALESYVDTAITNLVDVAPDALNTLNELAAALGDDANYAATITSALALKAPLASPTFTGVAAAPELLITDGSTKRYRLRTDGTNLDFTGYGRNIYISTYAAFDGSGTQQNYVEYGAEFNFEKHYSKTIWDNAGADMLVIDKDAAVEVALTGDMSISGDLTVGDEAYGSGWNGSTEVPTKNAVYDKIEALATEDIFLTVGPADADYITDGTADEVQINAAIAAAVSAGGGTVFIQAGTYNINAAINPKANVYLKGAGMFQTKLVATATLPGSVIADTTSFTAASPLEKFIVSDLEIDGSNMPTSPYSIGRKGIDSKCWRNCVVQNLYIHDTPATALGIDNLDRCLIDHVIAKDCGTSGEDQGSNGIGIGTGGMASESFVVSNCITEGIANSAYLLEELDTTTTDRHYVFANNISYSDFKGFSVSGGLDCIIANNQVYDSGDDGIRVIDFSSHLGGRTTIIGNQVEGSTSEGIYIDTDVSDCKIEGNVVRRGTIEGIVIRGSRNAIQNNHVYENGKHGIYIGAASGGDPITRINVQGNMVYNNSYVTANTDGIRLDATNATLTDITVTGNHSFDDQAVATQRYGLIVTGANAISQLIVTGNNFRANKTAALLNNASAVSAAMYMNNIGIATVASKTSSYTLLTSDNTILGNTTSGSITLTLPTAVGALQSYTIKKTASANTLNIATTSSQTIDGSTSIAMTRQYESITLVSDNTNWNVI